MTIRQTETFDISGIEQVTLQFADNVDNIACVGSISGTTEMRLLTRSCRGVQSSIANPQKLTVTLSLYMPVETARDLYGLENDGLKTGIYAYTSSSKSKEFAFTARFRDDFQDKQKIIAIPSCRVTTGLSFTADDEQTDIAKVTMDFEASLDELGNLYYEAMIDDKAGIKEADALKWEAGFKTALVKDTIAG